MVEKDDWRLQGQEKYLKNKKIFFKKYIKYSDKWDHEHCEFCGDKISQYEGDLNVGYCTEDEKYWICNDCYNDFKDMFNWKLNNL